MNLKHAFLKSFDPEEIREDFHVAVFRLIRRADKDNILKFQTGFPEHYQIYDAWKTHGVDYSNDTLVVDGPPIKFEPKK